MILILTDVLLINLGRTSGAEVNDLNFLKSFRLKHGEEAVSPVVGVMLMLVVTIIIAAVVSAFAGGLGTTTAKPPTVAMDVTIKNTGSAYSSYIQFDVQSASEAIPTKNLKIITSWTTSSGVTGGNTTMAGLNAPNTMIPTKSGGTNSYQAPIGFGNGVTLQTLTSQKTSTPYDPGQMFGNYTLTTGTTMRTSAGYTSDTVSPYPMTGGYGYATPYVYSNDYARLYRRDAGYPWRELECDAPGRYCQC